jgi:hypothetical protein
MLYEPGEDVTLIGELFPAVIDAPVGQYPSVLPTQLDPETNEQVAMTGILMKVFMTGRGLLVGWGLGGTISYAEIPLSEDDMSGVTYRGGQAGTYGLRVTGVCKCRDRRLAGWDIADVYVGSAILNEQRRDQAAATRNMSGLIPPRYSRAY